MKILGIETSCDETALALVEASGDKSPRFRMLKNVIASQVDVHKEYGGVVPGLAKREHAKNLIPVLYQVLELKTQNTKIKTTTKNLKLKNIETIFERYDDLQQEFKEKVAPLPKPDIDLIAVTRGPGLEPALWVGVNFARALSMLWDIPLIGVDHMEGHIAVNLLAAQQVDENSKLQFPNKIQFPAVALAVSGGHTQLILVRDWGDYKLLGETLDDAAGEAFDKVARLLGLPFPGGPYIEKASKEGDAKKFDFPRPMHASGDYNFSFSGLKTAVLYAVKKLGKKETEEQKNDIAASFQQAAIEVLVSKTVKAAKENKAKTIMLAGGVAANQALKEQLSEKVKIELPSANYLVPEIKLATDNGVMIAIAGYLRYAAGKKSNWKTLVADSNKLITE